MKIICSYEKQERWRDCLQGPGAIGQVGMASNWPGWARNATKKPSGGWATVVGHEHLHRAVPASNPALTKYLAISSGHFCLDSLENSSQKYKRCSWARECGWSTNLSISQQNRPSDRLQPELLRGKVFPSVEILRGIPGKGETGHKRKAGPAGQLHDTHRGLRSG